MVGSEQDFPPFALGYSDADAGGFTVELWRQVAREEGLKYRIEVRPFSRLLEEFRQGRVDVLLNLAQSDERRRFASFSVTHAKVDGGIFVRKGRSGIRSEADLADKSVIVIRSDLGHDYAVAQHWLRPLVLVDNALDGFRLLDAGKHDAMLVGKLAGMQTLQKYDLSGIEALSAKAGFSQRFAFAVHKEDDELLAAINEGLAVAKTNGAYDALYEKWFGIYEPRTLSRGDVLRYAALLGLIVAALAALFLYRRHAERVRAQEVLRHSEERFRSLTDLSSDWYWEQDDQFRNVFNSPRYSDSAGLRMRPVTGQRRWETDNIWDSDEQLNEHKAALAAHRPFYDLHLRRADEDGVVRHLLISGTPVFDSAGRFAGYRGVGRDITETKRATDQLHESERRIQTIINNVPATIGYWDRNARLVFGNKAMEALFGGELGELAGRHLSEILSEEAYRVAAPHVEAVLRGEAPIFEREAPQADGPPRRLQIALRPDIADGEVIGFFALTTDITQLSQLVDERTRDLFVAKQRAEGANAAKDEFLANVSHEMRTPLHAIKAFTALSLKRIEGGADDKLLRYLQNTDESARRLHRFVEDLLALAKHQATQRTAARGPVDFVERVESVRRRLEALLAAKDLRLELNVATTDTIVLADESMVDQIVTNLISNAIKFSPEGGKVTLSLVDDLLPADGGQEVPCEALRLSVGDHGIGVPEGELEKIFNKFEQSSRTKTGAGGTGLGLAICREIMLQHHGWIRARNNSGGGATFDAWFPRAARTELPARVAQG